MTFIIVNLANEILEFYNPEVCLYPGNYPTGETIWTKDKNKALKFNSVKEALELWNRQSVVTPFRPDGLPNKPLTSFSITIVNEEKYNFQYLC